MLVPGKLNGCVLYQMSDQKIDSDGKHVWFYWQTILNWAKPCLIHSHNTGINLRIKREQQQKVLLQYLGGPMNYKVW